MRQRSSTCMCRSEATNAQGICTHSLMTQKGRHQMSDVQLLLTPEEQELLLELLETNRRQTRVEARHTRARAYKEHVLHHETLIDGLLAKLRQQVGEPAGSASHT